MKNFYILSFVCCFFLSNISFGQEAVNTRSCGAKHFHNKQMENEQFKTKHQKQLAVISKQLAENTHTKAAPCSNPIIIPVAVHYNEGVTVADTQCLIDAAQAQIATLNEDFSASNMDIANFCAYSSACPMQYNPTTLASNGVCVQFCLADQNLPTGEDNIGGYAVTLNDYKWTGGVDAPNWTGYLNLFVYEDTATVGYLGVAPYGGGFNPNGNGVYINYYYFGGRGLANGCVSGNQIGGNSPFNLGRTGTHEVGHYFALDHVFDDYNETGQCSASDFFAPANDDTPAQNVENYGTPTIGYTNCSSTSENSCGEADYFFNFMDYVNDDIMVMFTEGQANVMTTVIGAQSKWNSNSISCYNDYQSGALSYQPIFKNGCPSNCYDVTYTGNDGLQATIYLEGFFDGTGNNTTLNTKELIPNLQPYNYPPFNYDGFEYMASFSNNIVDWIYLEILDGSDNIVAARAALLTTTGQIIDVDGGTEIHFPCLTNGNSYTLTVYHKSHLGIASSSVFNYPSATNYNFSTGTNTVRGNEQLKDVSGTFCLYAGDFDGNGLINNLDFNKWKSQSALVNNYVTWDADGSGIVNNLDYNLWENNRAKVGEPVIYK